MSAGVTGYDFTTLLLGTQRRLYAYILTLVPSTADADDVLQETNAVLLRKSGEFQAGSSFGAWACQVAYYEALAFYKRKNRDRRLLADEELLLVLAREAEARCNLIDQRASALDACMQKLPAEERELVKMRYGEELTSDDMAERLKRSAEAVRRHLFRIRRSLLACVMARLRLENDS